MKTGMTRISAFLMSAVLLIGMTGCSGKEKYKEMKKSAEGAVENYLVYLATGKYDKLSRYCVPKDDQFQDIAEFANSGETTSKESPDLEKVYPHPDYLPYWQAYLSHLKFTFGDFTLDGNEGKLDIDLNLIDAKKALRSSVDPSSADILYFLTEADTYMNKKITLSLDFDPDDGTCKIKNTQVLFKECKKQFDIILEKLPKKNAKLDKLLHEFMDHVIDMDTEYLQNDAFYLGFDLSEYYYYYIPYYKAMTSFYTYDYEFIEAGDDWAEFKMTVHKKDEENALLSFFRDPVNLAPSYEKILTYAIKAPQGFNGLEDLWPVDPQIPGFTEFLKNMNDKDFSVHGEIRLDPNVPLGYRVTGSFNGAFPTIITDHYTDLYGDEGFVRDIYIQAMQNLKNNGTITQQEFERLQRLDKFRLVSTKYEAIMTEHGYTQSARGKGGFHSYSKDERIFVDVETFDDSTGIDAAIIEGMNSYTDLETKIASGDCPGELTGGWTFYEFYGKTTTGDLPPEDTYICCIAVENRLFSFTINNYTDEEVCEIKDLIHELQLD